ncbi:Txe/YoeB family addiction module toxin [Micromonospora sp. NPDC000089]|uniref:Txe/YoeB family addiction module toxin n=1 Tax=unclassified Micromonospora TaxID=2617518 RepID=UPI0036AFFC05
MGGLRRLVTPGREDGPPHQQLILDVQRDPHGTGLGKPELLKGPLSGWSSRRINDEDRLIYRVRGGDLEIVACHGHYLDK